MEFTGERLVPGKVNADLWAEHISRYDYAAQYARGRVVLDIGCGAGYGTALLATTANSAVGLDFAADAVRHAKETYNAPHLTFTQASATALPYPAHSFDLITAFEVIEHLGHWRDMLSEAARVLKPYGLFLVSTPNRNYYTESRAGAGANPFHVHEFDYQEFASALAEYFPKTQILLQNRVDAFAFYLPKTTAPGTSHLQTAQATATEQTDTAYFFLGCCSLETPLPTASYIHVAEASNLLRERERHIGALQQQLAEKIAQYEAIDRANQTLQTTLTERTAWAVDMKEQLEQATGQVVDLQRHLEQQNNWALHLEKDLTTAREQHAHLHSLFEERTTWALELEKHLTSATHELARHRDLLQHWQSASDASRWMRLGRKLSLGPQYPSLETKKDT